MNPHDIFGMMGGGVHMADLFGGGMGGGGGMRKRKGRDVGVRMPVPLEALYKGETKEVEIPRVILCPPCKGTGSKNAKKSGCQECQGKGSKIIRRMLGPGMVQQMQVPCDACGGQGNTIKEKDRCTACQGQRVKEVDRKLKVNIKAGMEHGAQIPFMEEGDQHPDIDIPGAIVVVLQQEEHEKFTRDGDDLFTTHTITLQEGLLGFAFELVHLDGRKLYVNSPTGKVVTPEQKLTIKGEGMPKEGTPGQRGDLHIEFKMEFPRMLDDDQMDILKKIFPTKKVDKDHKTGEEPEECFMDGYDPEEWKNHAKIGEDEEEDIEEESGGQQVRCAHQ